ncbi:TfoX/Sxy family protein [Sphingomonas aracearum]|uniref:TfoX/Sxy family protein n=1 Tax=Sphingomonas aracearum TaxID=2283317 RepID=UPI001EF08E62|nr:TfoX/Sxy family protein [Sphingomonas aracearum]
MGGRGDGAGRDDQLRAMMGGATLYCDGVVFAIQAGDGGLWFKSDAQSDATWDEAGCDRFTYDRDGTPATMNYRRAPDAVFDDEEEFRRWAELALEAGRRAPAKKKRAARLS